MEIELPVVRALSSFYGDLKQDISTDLRRDAITTATETPLGILSARNLTR